MTARDTLHTIVQGWADRNGGDQLTAQALLDAYRAEVLREAAGELDAASIVPGPRHAAALLRGLGDTGRPSRFHATPAEIDAFLRFHFAEDTLLRYQWAIGDAAAHEAAVDARALQPEVPAGHTLRAAFVAAWQEGASDAADLIDPAKGGGHYPSMLVDFTPKES
jgi:hypothetical protein